jgi:aryl carrier-like protein
MNTEHSELSGPEEAVLRRLFAEILKVPEIHPHDTFFGLAGDSITALRLVRRARGEGLPIGIEDVFQNGTVRALAVAAKRARESEQPPEEQLAGSDAPLGLVELSSEELADLELEFEDGS